MRVVIAPDSFGGTLTARQAADAIATGWRAAHPRAELDLAPMSDGGPGFVDVLESSLGGARVAVTARDPYLRPVRASILLAEGTAYVETAAACGLHLVGRHERRPLEESTAGVGELLQAAERLGAGRIVAGLGGSATNDGGAGMLGVMGLEMLDAGDERIEPTARALGRLDRIVPRAGWRPGVPLEAATDVDSPLLGPEGATAMFGPQKGASSSDLEELEACLARLVVVARRHLPETAGLETVPGSGAAGGLGFGILALGGVITSGSELVISAVSLEERISRADAVITGEGSFDAQSLRGKVAVGVARAARSAGVPCLVLAGKISVIPEDLGHLGIAAAWSLVDEAGAGATSHPPESLTAMAERAGRLFRP